MIGWAVGLALTAQAGMPAVDSTVTPVKPLAAARAAAPLDDTCDEPVLLIASGPVRDSTRMEVYAKAVANSGLYQQLGGYELAAGRPLDVLEGNSLASFVNVVARFPCRANALAFWNSRTYQEHLRALRTNPPASELVVAIYAENPIRADMIGKVGDNSYSAAFDSAAVSQAAQQKP
jgi:uncharacterized protein (DUF1330 family)